MLTDEARERVGEAEAWMDTEFDEVAMPREENCRQEVKRLGLKSEGLTNF